jgi:MOSC domain-containing protein YiiM
VATVISVNVGRAGALRVGTRVLHSGFVKRPVAGAVAARGVNLEGDEQGDREHHGGTGQAVYAYAAEDAAWWAAELGQALAPGAFAENLTLEGIDVTAARIGERWTIGSVELQVTGPRIPCAKLGASLGDPRLVRRFARAGRPGAYLAIVREGTLEAGDAIEVVHRPAHDVTVALVAVAFLLDPSRLPELAPALPDLAPRFRAELEART